MEDRRSGILWSLFGIMITMGFFIFVMRKMKGRYEKVGNVSFGAFLIEESASLVILSNASGPVCRDLTSRGWYATLDEMQTR